MNSLFKGKMKGNAKTNDDLSKKNVSGAGRSVQDILDFDDITSQDGILKIKGGYSKMYKLIDANYALEPDDKKVDMLSDFKKLLNKFPDYVSVNLIVRNKRRTVESLMEDYHLKYLGDGLDAFREDYNTGIIDVKIAESAGKDEDGKRTLTKNITKEKYIVLTVHKNTLKEAMNEFNICDVSIKEATIKLNKSREGVLPVSTYERLKLMREILNGAELLPFEKQYARYIDEIDDGEGHIRTVINKKKLRKSGITSQDIVASQHISKHGKGAKELQLSDNRVCKSFAYRTLPQLLSEQFLTKISNISYEAVTVINLKVIPHKRAQTMVKNALNNAKADAFKRNKKANVEGVSATVMIDEETQSTLEHFTRLRKSIVEEHNKLFYMTGVTTIFAENSEELEQAVGNYLGVCNDCSLSPNYLIGQQIEGLNTAICTGDTKIKIDHTLPLDEAISLNPFDIQELNDGKGAHFYGNNTVSKDTLMFARKYADLGNGMIYGTSGSGKSFAVKTEIIPNILDGNDDIIILDPENEYDVLCEAFGGVRIDISTKSQYTVNPLDMSMEWDDEDADPLREKCDFMVGLVETMRGNGIACNALEINSIHKATMAIYENYISEMEDRHSIDPNCPDVDSAICPTLIDFLDALNNLRTPDALKLGASIEPFCSARGQYNLFSKKTNIPAHSRLIVYNLSKLGENPVLNELAMKVCLTSIWNTMVDNKRKNKLNGTNKFIWTYLDEFHLFFKSEKTAQIIASYYKRCRKYAGIMTGITQDVSDIISTRHGQAMFNNSGFFMFLKQASLSRMQLKQLYELSDTLLDYIKDTPRGQGLIYNTRVWCPFNIEIPNNTLLYAIMTTNPNDEAKRIKLKQVLEATKEERVKKQVG